MKNLKNVIIGVVVILSASCIGGSQEYKLARNFIDAYYVMADLQNAKALTKDAASLKIDDQIKLTDELKPFASTYGVKQGFRSRDIEFELKDEAQNGNETTLKFEFTIHHPNSADEKRNVYIKIDRVDGKVTLFGEY